MSLVEYTNDHRGVGEVLLNRPEKLNAFSRSLLEDLKMLLQKIHSEVSQNKVRVLIIHSAAAPKAFCAGADLQERLAMNESQVAETLKFQRAIVDSIASIEVTTIAVIDGIAFGGGLELTLACDLRVASDASQLGLTETRMGIIPGAGGTQRLMTIVGEAKAKEMILLGKKITAEEALRLGLINCIAIDPIKKAREWADETLQCAPLAVKAAKKAIEGNRLSTFSQRLDFERECYESVLKSTDRVEGLKAFSEKRKPDYRGK